MQPEDPEAIDQPKRKGLKPFTRQLLIWSVAWIAALCIGAEVFLVYMGHETSDGLVSLAATCVGVLGGMAVPGPSSDVR